MITLGRVHDPKNLPDAFLGWGGTASSDCMTTQSVTQGLRTVQQEGVGSTDEDTVVPTARNRAAFRLGHATLSKYAGHSTKAGQ